MHRVDLDTLRLLHTSDTGRVTDLCEGRGVSDVTDLCILIEDLAQGGVITQATADALLSEIIVEDGDSDSGDYDDGQPDEAQEWADFDPWC
jgi:hypothetical protein